MVMKLQAAPVAIFAFNRPDFLEKTLRALQKCYGLEDRRVIIYCDGARNGVDSDVVTTQQVRSVATLWGHGRFVEVVESSVNRGLRLSIISGVRQLADQHGRVIVLEDDILVSRWFLKFMDESLERFAEDERVWQVSGWSPPSGLLGGKSGFLRVPGCWGWATWKRAWDHYRDDAEALLQAIRSDDVTRFNIDDCYDYFTALQRNATGLQNTWQVRWYASMFLQRALAVYPGTSLARNIGFDLRGTNCGADATARRFLRQRLALFCPAVPVAAADLQESKGLAANLRQLFRWQSAVWTGASLKTRLRLHLRGMLGDS